MKDFLQKRMWTDNFRKNCFIYIMSVNHMRHMLWTEPFYSPEYLKANLIYYFLQMINSNKKLIYNFKVIKDVKKDYCSSTAV